MGDGFSVLNVRLLHPASVGIVGKGDAVKACELRTFPGCGLATVGGRIAESIIRESRAVIGHQSIGEGSVVYPGIGRGWRAKRGCGGVCVILARGYVTASIVGVGTGLTQPLLILTSQEPFIRVLKACRRRSPANRLIVGEHSVHRVVGGSFGVAVRTVKLMDYACRQGGDVALGFLCIV